jgi:hypothetical protein
VPNIERAISEVLSDFCGETLPLDYFEPGPKFGKLVSHPSPHEKSAISDGLRANSSRTAPGLPVEATHGHAINRPC